MHLGLPGNLARLIANFYTRQYRYLVMDGVAHPFAHPGAVWLATGMPHVGGLGQ